MYHPHATEHHQQRPEELISWTFPERLRFLWYRLRLTISEMNYAARRMAELQARLKGRDCRRPKPSCVTRGDRYAPALSYELAQATMTDLRHQAQRQARARAARRSQSASRQCRRRCSCADSSQ
jgi:hypothetical protein